MVAGRLAEEELYGQVAQEIAQSILMESLWAKAVAQGNGSMDRAHSIYIKLRVQDLSNNIYIEGTSKNRHFQRRIGGSSLNHVNLPIF